MNKVILMGRLVADPDTRQTQNGVAVAGFTIAVNRRFAKEGQQQADFIKCIAWRKTAEIVCKYFHKGNMIAVVGSIQTRSWEEPIGTKHFMTEVLADEVYFTGEKNSQNNSKGETFGGVDGFTEISIDEDLPF